VVSTVWCADGKSPAIMRRCGLRSLVIKIIQDRNKTNREVR
jgi:hypothetical protein